MMPKFSRFITVLIALCVLQMSVMPASAGVDSNPLKPIDTSSPRATLQGFIEFTNKAYETGAGFIDAYMASSELYLTPEEMVYLKEANRYQKSAQRALDLRGEKHSLPASIQTPEIL